MTKKQGVSRTTPVRSRVVRARLTEQEVQELEQFISTGEMSRTIRRLLRDYVDLRKRERFTGEEQHEPHNDRLHFHPGDE